MMPLGHDGICCCHILLYQAIRNMIAEQGKLHLVRGSLSIRAKPFDIGGGVSLHQTQRDCLQLGPLSIRDKPFDI